MPEKPLEFQPGRRGAPFVGPHPANEAPPPEGAPPEGPPPEVRDAEFQEVAPAAPEPVVTYVIECTEPGFNGNRYGIEFRNSIGLCPSDAVLVYDGPASTAANRQIPHRVRDLLVNDLGMRDITAERAARA